MKQGIRLMGIIFACFMGFVMPMDYPKHAVKLVDGDIISPLPKELDLLQKSHLFQMQSEWSGDFWLELPITKREYDTFMQLAMPGKIGQLKAIYHKKFLYELSTVELVELIRLANKILIDSVADDALAILIEQLADPKKLVEYITYGVKLTRDMPATLKSKMINQIHRLLEKLELPKLNIGKIQAAGVFSPDSSLFATTEDLTVKIWDLKNQKLKDSLSFGGLRGKLLAHYIIAEAFSDDSNLLAINIPRQSVITIIDLKTRQEKRVFKYNGWPVRMAFYGDQDLLVTFDGGTTSIFNIASGREDKAFGSSAAVLALSPNKSLGATVDGQTIEIWDVKTREIIRSFPQNNNDSFVTFSPDSKLLLVFRDIAGRFGAKIINIQDENELYTLQTSNFVFSLDSKAIFYADGASIKMRDIQTGEEKIFIQTRAHRFNIAGITDQWLMLREGRKTIFYDINTAQKINEQNDWFFINSISHDGRWLLCYGNNGSNVYDTLPLNLWRFDLALLNFEQLLLINSIIQQYSQKKPLDLNSYPSIRTLFLILPKEVKQYLQPLLKK